MPVFEIKYSFPKLNKSKLEELEDILSEEFDYASLPNDYKKFLLKNNGGYISPGYIDTDEYEPPEEIVVFEINLKSIYRKEDLTTYSVYAFFSFWLEKYGKEDEIIRPDLYDIVASNEHSIEWGILPLDMMSIAKCSNELDSLVCISLSEEDYGSIYFYYGLWHHQANMFGEYYNIKKQEILNKYGEDAEKILNDEEHELNFKLEDEIRRSHFIKIADSFSEFILKLKREKNN
jgi:hypothetical protein